MNRLTKSVVWGFLFLACFMDPMDARSETPNTPGSPGVEELKARMSLTAAAARMARMVREKLHRKNKITRTGKKAGPAVPVRVKIPRPYSRSSVPASDPAPLSLTASDGTGLRLVSLSARAVVEGPIAFTEMDLLFKNPNNRQVEGRFEITLPDGAAISRFAMRIDTGSKRIWQEAEVVERQKARQTYDQFLHRNVDPALLEKKAGNQFRARVFPITDRELNSHSHLPA